MKKFEIVKIEKANKPGHAVATITFEGSDKEYNYVRKAHETKEGYMIIIDGVKINCDKNYNLLKTTEIYDTKGYKKTGKDTLSDKIKKEMNSTEKEEKVVTKTKEIKHEKYETIKTCLECNIPIYLAGPAGSGKNFTVEQIAKELGWNFYFSNSVQQEFKLTGFIDAGGKFHETEFYKACTDENDCIFFLDEMDASISEVLVLLNAAIANGYFEFPNGKVNFDKVHFVAAGNTVGSGSDELYTGRMVLDQATLDRFAIIDFDYSKQVEMFLTENNEELVEFIRELRKQAQNKGIRTTFSYRCMSMVTKLEKTKMKLEEILRISVFKGLDKDTINTFTVKNSSAGKKYFEAMQKVQRAA